ncbi:hypothetical protein GCM10012275_22120 [Longimycelium tulufanense]|uniref:Glycosyltransferase 2-like domain-containing protein n=1 Tax=Longimycelium tulufanense TaxID=907463 RepID=A0A8J3CD10_9PSEU|nr:glycosyltransferase [Longimycelium tulufanense]GGM50828.1 hypothetical protein GCM10012275_22120 [Longimycelium tulufanense]
MSRVACRGCSSPSGSVVLDLGEQPVCTEFPAVADTGPDRTHELRMWLCGSCGLAQLVADPGLPESAAGIEPAALRDQAAQAVDQLLAAGLVRPDTTVAEYRSPHGGAWTEHLVRHGMRPVWPGQRAELVVDSFGMMHEPDQAAAVAQRAESLTDDGVLALQFHSLQSIVRGRQWNVLRHGHFAYYSAHALVALLREVGLVPLQAWHFDLYGGTVLLTAGRHGEPHMSVSGLLQQERTHRITNPASVSRLQHFADDTVEQLRGWLEQNRAAGRKVIGYGAASRVVALLNCAGVDVDLLPAIADAAPGKQGCRLPGTSIPVISPEDLVSAQPDVVLVLLADLLPEIRASLSELDRPDVRWAVAEPRVVEVPRPEQAAPALVGRAAPPITVGLPVRNGEPYLYEALDTLLAQQDADFELHIADNCSDDATEEICRAYAEKDERVRYHRRERNVGVTDNHNRLVRDARSPYFTWAASDDAYHPDRLTRLLEALRADPSAVLSFTAARQIDAEGQAIGEWRNPCRTDHPDPIVRITDLIALEHENYHCYGLVRREALLRTSLLPPVKNNDRILVAELALHGRFAEVDEDLLWHRLHDRRLTQRTTARQWYLEQRSGPPPRVVLPDVEEALWYLRAVVRSPLPARDRARAMLALRPWFRRRARPMARNVARLVIERAGLGQTRRG